MDHEDVDGLIDVAKYGIEPMMKIPRTRQLMQSLAENIACQAVGKEIEKVDFDPNSKEDDDSPFVEGQAVMMIFPLSPLEQ